MASVQHLVSLWQCRASSPIRRHLHPRLRDLRRDPPQGRGGLGPASRRRRLRGHRPGGARHVGGHQPGAVAWTHARAAILGGAAHWSQLPVYPPAEVGRALAVVVATRPFPGGPHPLDSVSYCDVSGEDYVPASHSRSRRPPAPPAIGGRIVDEEAYQRSVSRCRRSAGRPRRRPSGSAGRHRPQLLARATAPVTGKVGVLSGGGSGHEPLHGGFVGRGMLDAACSRRGLHVADARPDLEATKPSTAARACCTS